ncbi:PD40 domain-containing protein [Chryseolinea lacunae]|uniref:PD40 domain-containing protein n=1 Tax=Chryseolinea lacunae TaxID=2801331 RepID=A0ABS1KQ43_9BACT|nr:PD40 domain-containing protein [Chryseolinea lacunae]MBL0741362.1 PD40 domain-containing protein [Chryseolinea lacunae]
MKTLLPFVIILVMLTLLSCGDDASEKNGSCPPFSIVPSAPYSNPIWHPNGDIIGFNHRPIKEIDYGYGKDCPLQATYTYKEDSVGFWLAGSDGTNKRRALPAMLETPVWSRDGKWIAFGFSGGIYKMPFDGAEFDTTNIILLTKSGRNFFPAWSPDDSFIAFDNTDCGSATTPVPPNSCGTLVVNNNGDDLKYYGLGRMPYWGLDNKAVFTGGVKYDTGTGEATTFFDPNANKVVFDGPPQFSPDGKTIAFVGHYTNTPTAFSMLFRMEADGSKLKTITDEHITHFSWSPSGKIVYSKFDYQGVDDVNGTLWTMNADGTNKKQITFNRFNAW